MAIDTRLFGFILHMIVWTFLLSWLLLWMRRRPGDKPRYCLAIIFFTAWLHFAERLVAFYQGGITGPDVLPVSYVIGGWMGISTVYLYPITLINSGWLNWRKGALLIAPWILMTFLLLVLPVEFRQLSSFSDMTEHIAEFNVWFRLLLILVVPVYAFLLFYIPYNWKNSSITHRWVYYCTFWWLAICLLYTLFTLTGWMAVICIHHTVCLLFCIVATYQELYIRIPVPVKKPEKVLPTPSPSLQADSAAVETIIPVEEPEEIIAVKETVLPEKNTCHPLWNELDKLMEQEELWRNPDMSLEDLAARLNTNRTTLAQVIRQETNEGYKEYINRFRIDEFMKIINTKKLPNIQEEFFKVGFRSKATALRHFKEYTGITPSDYLRKIADEN